MKPPYARRADRIAVAALLAAAFEGTHGFGDQWCQASRDSAGKGSYGTQLVHLKDGSPVDPDSPVPPAGPTLSATAYGRLCAARHVVAYSVVQTTATLLLTRLLGFRVKPSSVAVGLLINASTHAVIDRREPLLRLAKVFRKTGYIEHCQAVIPNPDSEGGFVARTSGPGSALFELDQSLHRLIGLFAAAVTAWHSTRASD